MKPEQLFKAKVTKEFRRRGCLVVPAEMLHCPGFPDLMVIKNGRCLLVEIKVLPGPRPWTKSLLRPDQYVFALKCKEVDARTYLFVKMGDDYVFGQTPDTPTSWDGCLKGSKDINEVFDFIFKEVLI